MKSILILPLLLCFYCCAIWGQSVTTNPIFPNANSTIAITYDASEGNTALIGSTNVTMHVGLVTSNSLHANDLKYTQDGLSMTQLGPNKWSINLSVPNTFPLEAWEVAEQLVFNFRNDDAALVGKSSDNKDFRLDLKDAPLKARFTNPFEDGLFMSVNQPINIQAAATQVMQLSLEINGQQVYTVNNNLLEYQTTFTEYGKHWVYLFAYEELDQTEIIDSFYVMIQPPVTIAELPNGMQDGVNYINDNSVVLSLYAPEKDFSYVVGSFNNWQVDPDYFMQKTPDGKRFWIQLFNMDSFEEHQYQYAIDNELQVADPFTEKILDPFYDGGIDEVTYPNPSPYPFDQTNGAVSTFKIVDNEYVWETVGYDNPTQTKLVIYELLLRDFVEEHNFQTLKDSLTYIQGMGVNAINLLPIAEYQGNVSWGDEQTYYLAPDKYYGTKNQLKSLIDACHQLGMAVILDFSLEHTSLVSPFAKMYWDSNNQRPAANNPWLNAIAPHPSNPGGLDYNHEAEGTQLLVDRLISHWANEYRVDGFRLKNTKGFTQANSANDEEWSAYDANRKNRLIDITNHAWNQNAGIYMIIDHDTAPQEQKELADYGLVVMSNMNANYGSLALANSADLGAVSYLNNDFTKANLLPYMERHDTERLMFHMLSQGAALGSYDISYTGVALERMKLLNTFYLTIPGPKMIQQFSELGYDESSYLNCLECPKPIHWEYQSNEERQNVYKVFAALNQLKRDYPTFSTDDFEIVDDILTKQIILRNPEMNAHIIGNFSNTTELMMVNFESSGTWYEYFTGNELVVNSVPTTLFTYPGEFRIYTTMALPTPEEGITQPIVDTPTDLEDLAHIGFSAYPNPMQTDLSIEFTSPSDQHTIGIYNIKGQLISDLKNNSFDGLNHQYHWDGKGLDGTEVPNGVYYIHLNIDGYSKMEKLVIAR